MKEGVTFAPDTVDPVIFPLTNYPGNGILLLNR